MMNMNVKQMYYHSFIFNSMKASFLTTLLLGLCTAASSQQIDKTTISSFDLERYLGKWYEIARYDHSFERDLVGTVAEYSLRKDGKIQVLNSGYLKTLDGPYKESVGKAKPNKNGKPGQLRVSFFGPFYSDYNILELAPNYSYSVVGSASPKYLWILSRTPHISPELRTALIKKIQKRGYDTTKLIWVEQK